MIDRIHANTGHVLIKASVALIAVAAYLNISILPLNAEEFKEPERMSEEQVLDLSDPAVDRPNPGSLESTTEWEETDRGRIDESAAPSQPQDRTKTIIKNQADGEVNVTIENRESFYEYLSADNLIGIKRRGELPVKKITTIVVDDQELEQTSYVINERDGYQLIIFDANLFQSNPPSRIEITLGGSENDNFEMAAVEELDSREDLETNADFGRGHNDSPNPWNRAAGQCEPYGNISKRTEQKSVNKPIFNHNTYSQGTLLMTIEGLKPESLIYEIVLSQNSYFRLDGSDVLLFQNDEGQLSQVNRERNNHRPVDRVSLSNGDKTIALEFSPVTVGKSGKIDVVLPSANGVGYGLKSIISYVDDYGAYAAPAMESDLATYTGKRALGRQEPYQGTSVYISEHSTKEETSGTTLKLKKEGNQLLQTVGASNWRYDSLAYSASDGWLYAVSTEKSGDNSGCYPPAHLLQINPSTGKARNLGPLKNFKGGEFFIDEVSRRDKGTLDVSVVVNESLYLASSTGSYTFYKIPLPTNKSESFKLGSPVIDRIIHSAYSADYAKLPNDPKHIWGIVSKKALQDSEDEQLSQYKGKTNAIIVERIEIEGTNKQYYELVGEDRKNPLGHSLESADKWPSAWTYGNGNIGFLSTASKGKEPQGFQVKISKESSPKPQFEVQEIFTLEDSHVSLDAASNSDRSEVKKANLQIKKQHLHGQLNTIDSEEIEKLKAQGANTSDYHYWSINIENLGEGSSAGMRVEDYLPSAFDFSSLRIGYRGLNQSLRNFVVDRKVNGLKPGFGQNATLLDITVGHLPPKHSFRLYIAAKLKPNASCMTNHVRLVPHDHDRNPSVYKEADAECASLQPVDFRLDLLDGLEFERNHITEKLSGAEFMVYEGKPGETQFDPDVSLGWSTKLSEIQGSGTYAAQQRLSPDKFYWLVEHQPPTKSEGVRSYTKIAEPLLFRIVSDQHTRANVEFFVQKPSRRCHGNAKWSSCYDLASFDSAKAVSTMAQVQLLNYPLSTQPELPKTGGAGIYFPLLVGFGILLVGISVAFRRNSMFLTK